jgi:hypothetical protein
VITDPQTPDSAATQVIAKPGRLASAFMCIVI